MQLLRYVSACSVARKNILYELHIVQWQAGGKLGLRAASSEKRRRWNRIHCHWYRTQVTKWYRIQCSGIVYYARNSDYCGLNQALLYPVQSGPMCRYDPPQWQNRADTTVWEHRQAQLGLAHTVVHHRHTVVSSQT